MNIDTALTKDFDILLNEAFDITNELIVVMNRVKQHEEAGTGVFNLDVLVSINRLPRYSFGTFDEEIALNCGSHACIAGWYGLSEEGRARGFFSNLGFFSFNFNYIVKNTEGILNGFDYLIELFGKTGVRSVSWMEDFFGTKYNGKVWRNLYEEVTVDMVLKELELIKRDLLKTIGASVT